MDTAGPDRAIYKGEKSLGVYSFTRQGVVSQKPSDASTKNALSLVTRCSAGQILVQKFTKFDSPQQTVPTKQPIYFGCVYAWGATLCSIFCNHSEHYELSCFDRETHSILYPVTLKQ